MHRSRQRKLEVQFLPEFSSRRVQIRLCLLNPARNWYFAK